MARILFVIAGNCNSRFKCNYLKNEKIILNFLFHFWNLHQILNSFKKKMMVLANVFSNIQTVKNILTPLCKKLRFGTRFKSRHVKLSWIPAKSPWECFYRGFSSISGKLNLIISALFLREFLGVFVNTLTADGNYPFQDSGN